MNLENAAWAIFGLIAGSAISWIVSKYYFHRTQEFTRLSVTTMGEDRVISVPATYDGDLEIHYKGRSVRELHQVSIFIGNSGNRPIVANGKPLTLVIEGGHEIVERQVSRVEPKERNVQLGEWQRNGKLEKIPIEFPLLNANDFFIVKLLSLTPIHSKQVSAKAELAEIPATVMASRLPVEWYAPRHNYPRFKNRVVAGLGGLFLALTAFLVASSGIQHLDEAIAASKSAGLSVLSTVLWLQIVVVWLCSLVLAILGVVAGSEAFRFELKWGRYTPCFRLNSDVAIPHFGILEPRPD